MEKTETKPKEKTTQANVETPLATPSQAERQNQGGFAPPAVRPSGGMMNVASTRAAQEVQAAMVIAKNFPRDESTSYQKIIRGCQRKALAAQAVYTYPKGNTTVTGPSIRLAEELARDWGNIDFGVIELEQRGGESDVMAYAWDLESNTRQTKIFTVKHMRHTRQGDYALTDPRDIYEMVANQGARRLRACILGIIPGDVQEAAVMECQKTLASGHKEPLADRINKMVVAFEPYGVSKEMMEKRLGHILKTTSEAEMVGLQTIFITLRDNMAPVTDLFPPDTPSRKGGVDELGGRLKNEKAGPKNETIDKETGEVIDNNKPSDNVVSTDGT